MTVLNDIWQSCLKLAGRAYNKSTIYKKLFNSLDAKDVLSDIAHFCGAFDIDLKRSKDGTLDPLDMARRAGKIEVYQYITKMLSMSETEKQALAMRYYEMQTRQTQDFK